MSRLLAFIGARGGSKGLPKKNVLSFAGKPLVVWSYETAKQCPLITDIFVSTDSEEVLTILKNSSEYSESYLRPVELALDSSSIIDAINHSLQWLANKGKTYDHVLLLQPTSPLRTTEHIQSAIDLYLASKTPSKTLLSVYELASKFNWILRQESDLVKFLQEGSQKSQRQGLRNKLFMPNGAIYIAPILENRVHDIFGENILPFVMSENESIDIDTSEDFIEAEKRFLNRSRE